MGFITTPSILCNYVNLVMSPLKTITQSDPVGLLVSFTELAIELDDDDDDNATKTMNVVYVFVWI